MTLGIGENLTNSFEFAKDGLVDHWDRWIILAVLLGISVIVELVAEFVVPFSGLYGILLLVSFIASCIAYCITYGYLVKIYKGGDIAPELEGYGEMFIDGLKLLIIQFVYGLIPMILITAGIVFAVFGGIALIAGAAEETAAAVGAASGMIGLLLILIGVVLLIFFGLVAIVASIRFAKTERFGEGFNLGEILATFREIGWGHFILSSILFTIVIFIILFIAGMITGILSLIPYIGWIRLVFVILLPLLFLWQGKFFENLYSGA